MQKVQGSIPVSQKEREKNKQQQKDSYRVVVDPFLHPSGVGEGIVTGGKGETLLGRQWRWADGVSFPSCSY